MKLYLMIICLITCLNMQGSDHAQLRDYLKINGNVAVIPTTDVKSSAQHFAKEFPFINIVSIQKYDDISQDNLNGCLNSSREQSTLILYPSSIYKGSETCMRHVNNRGFNAQVFGLHNPNVTQYPMVTSQLNTINQNNNNIAKINNAASSNIITYIQNFHSRWIYPCYSHFASAVLGAFVFYLCGKKS